MKERINNLLLELAKEINEKILANKFEMMDRRDSETKVTIKIGNDEDARRLFEEILNREPGYVGSYYHLAKLLERMEQTDEAIAMYEKGMQESKKAGDNHAFGELRGAYEELIF